MSNPDRTDERANSAFRLRCMVILCFAVALLVGAFSLLAIVSPGTVAGIRSYEDASGREAAVSLLHRIGPIGLAVGVLCGLIGLYFRKARKDVLSFSLVPETSEPNVHPNPSWKSEGRVAKAAMLFCTMFMVVMWLLPISDSLQDDEADKLEIGLGSMSVFKSNLFNVRMCILPLSIARATGRFTGIQHEWLLRLPIVMVFGGLFIGCLWGGFRRRFGVAAVCITTLFFGLHGIMGEYASKVQGYLPALALTTAYFLIWLSVMESRTRVSNRVLALITVLPVLAYLSHAFTVLFLFAVLVTSAVVDFVRLKRSEDRSVSAVVLSSSLLSMGMVTIMMLLGITSIRYHVSTSGADELQGSALLPTLSAVFTGMPNGVWAVLGLAVMAVLYAVEFKRNPESLDGALFLTVVGLLTIVFVVLKPRFFIDRFFIWMPILWLGPISRGAATFLNNLRARSVGLAGAGMIGLAAMVLTPLSFSQVRWQSQRTKDPDLQTAGEFGRVRSKLIQQQGRSAAFLLVRGRSNAAHRMWFYLPAKQTFRDKGRSGRVDWGRAKQFDVWLIPAFHGELSEDYWWVASSAVSATTAGNMTIYEVSSTVLPSAVENAR